MDIIATLKLALKVYIFLTLLYLLSKKNKHRILIPILALATFNIVLTDIFLHYKIPIFFNNNIYILVHQFLWLLLLKEFVSLKGYNVLLIFFLVFAIANLVFFEGINKLNTRTFVCSAFLYLALFIYECYRKLREEQLESFMENDFILYSSPLLFFVGFSLLFGFKNKTINDLVLFDKVNLYNFISYFVNFTFYTLINVYLYKEGKLKNAV